MKLLTIRILNINSLKGEFFIDFNAEPLSNTGLYAITGPTGSGKSTILDCITLALYGKTPRQSSVTKSTILNYGAIINKNSNEAVAEVEYQINDKYFLSKWSIKKNRNNNFNDYEMLFAEKKGKDYIPEVTKRSEVPKKNEEIIGLDYEQFLKSILLSQGEFASFLEADPGDRSKILEKITGSTVYREISIKSYEKQKTAKANLDTKKKEIEYVNLLSDEEIENINSEIAITEKEKNVIDNELNELLKKISAKKRLDEIEFLFKGISTEADKLNTEKKNFADKTNKLEIHKKLLPLKSNIDLYFNVKKTISDNKNNLQELTNKKKNTEIELVENNDNLKKLVKDKLVLDEEYKKLKPILKQTNQLDILINTEIEKNVVIKNQVTTKQNEKNEKEKEIAIIEEQLNKKKKAVSEKEEWIDTNKILKKLFVEIHSIKDKYELYTKSIEDLDSIIKSNPKIENEEVIKSDFVDLSIDEKHKKAESLYTEINNRKANIEKSITNKESIESLNELVKKHEKEIKTLAQLNDISKEYNEHNKKIQELVLSKENTVTKQKELEKLKQQSDNEFEILSAKIGELKAKRERQILERKYEADRLNLKENEECPLCGSTNHPLVKNYVNKVSETEKELYEKEKVGKELEKNIKTTNEKIIKNSEIINQINSTIQETKKKNEFLITEFNTVNIKHNFAIEEQKNIYTKLNNIESEKTYTSEQLETKQKLQTANFFAEIWSNILEKLRKINSLKINLEESFNPYTKFTSSDLNIKKRIELLENLSAKYELLNNEISELKKQIELHEANKKTINKHLSEIIKDLNSILEKDKTENEKINELKNKRYKLLSDNKVEEVEAEIENRIKTNDSKISEVEKIIIEKTTKLNSYKTQILSIKESLEKSDKENTELKNNLLKKVKDIGFSDLENTKNAILQSADAEQIEIKIKEFERIITELETTFKNLQSEKEKLLSEDKDKTDIVVLENQKNDLQEKQEEFSELIGKNLNKIETNEQNKKQHKDLANEYSLIEKEYKKWASLSELIGSADGDKFSKFAQDLTLLHLLKFANENMKQLSDRYIIIHEKHDKIDELFVIDTYMANEKRSVKTLSGGETFLVSLALALGLSKLAGKNANIESLFIDEGFGSLDEKTLDMALSTLENLQHKSNITIGIISHVKALKERIATQIILHKNNLGISSLEIIG